LSIVEQLIRPTGLLDPEIDIRPSKNQIKDLRGEIDKRVNRGERTLVTTLTKRMAEVLSDYLKERGVKVHYLHSDIQTLDRSDILDNLRLGKYDVVVGINLLREGLDLPEVSLIAILDADKEGFLRSETSLIQTMGRAARHVRGKVIMYADNKTGSMQRAIDEVNRRRNIQINYNLKHGIKPRSIKKPIREKLIKRQEKQKPGSSVIQLTKKQAVDINKIDPDSLTPKDKKKLIRGLTRRMNLAARELDFELAAKIRDTIRLIN
jgi:excinuclease ABC subunit B